MLLARHARLCLADVKDYVRAFNPLHRGVHNLAYATDVFVVDRVPLGFADLLENNLFCKLRGNASENAFSLFRDLQLAADFSIRIGFSRVINRDLKIRIFNLLRSLDDALHRKSANLARIFVELRAQVFLGLVVLAGGDNNGVFHRTDYNLRIDSLFPAQRINRVIELACHKSQCPVASG